MNKEVSFVDSIKCFGILAVILGHMPSPFGEFIFSWHMPLFFFIAGFFIKPQDSVLIFIRKSSKRLLLPYFIFAFLALAVVVIKDPILHRPQVNLLQNIIAIVFWMDTKHIQTYANILWFLPALFLARLAVFILLKYLKNFIMIACVLLAMACLSISYQPILPFTIPQAMASSIWLFAGYYYFNHFVPSQWFANNTRLVLIGLLLIIPIAFFKYPHLDVASLYFQKPFYNYYYSLAILIMLCSLFAKIKCLSGSGFINWLGRNTMTIFIFHTYLNNISWIIVEHLFPKANIINLWYLTFSISFIFIVAILCIKQVLQANRALKFFAVA
ncbi:MAG: hypothetical protein K0Q57_38 [Gammaproteobacteria bacterium]|jgi:fucose 4-O-acetylase-like acetyltransferase|nr:hypothetical protein [Gammaproteobacteria bacterium]